MSKYQEIINAATEDEELRTLMILNMNRKLNMVGGERPSDAARCEVRALEREGPMAYRLGPFGTWKTRVAADRRFNKEAKS